MTKASRRWFGCNGWLWSVLHRRLGMHKPVWLMSQQEIQEAMDELRMTNWRRMW